MQLIYSISIYLYSLFLVLASLFNKKARLWIKGRNGQWEKLKHAFKPSDKVIWVHCASLGEFEQGRPIIESLHEQYPGCKILLTFFSPSGYEVRKNYPGADHVIYLPSDTPINARRFISIVNPSMAIFVKYEFWYNYLIAIRKNKIPLFLISAIFRSDQHFFKSYGSWFRKQLNCFTCFFVQDEQSKKLLSGIGIKNVIVSGDSRFDRVIELAQGNEENEIVKHFKGDAFTIIAGSTWEDDEEMITKYINSHANQKVKWIIAPHVISDIHIQRLSSKIKRKSIRYSHALEGYNADVMIIDNIGLLAGLYRFADVAHIGGGFGKGIHNVLEPASYGLPLIFGPRYEKFREAKELLELKGAFTVKNYSEYEDVLQNLLSSEELRKNTSLICKRYVSENQGATRKILNKLPSVLS